MENSQDEQTPETGIQYIFHGCRWSFESIGLVMACIYLISQRLVMWSVGLFLYTGADDENVVQHIIERKDGVKAKGLTDPDERLHHAAI